MPTLFKRSNGVYTVVVDQTGRRRWVSTRQRTKSLALENLVPVHSKEPKVALGKTLQDFCAEFMEYAQQVHSPGNIGVYHRAFSSFLRIAGDVVLSAVNQRSVDQFKAKRLSDGITKTTLNLELRSLQAAFQFAVRWEYIPTNPFKGVRLLESGNQQRNGLPQAIP